MLRVMYFNCLLESLPTNIAKKAIDSVTKTGTCVLRTASKKVQRKTAEATGDLIANKIVNNITKCFK